MAKEEKEGKGGGKQLNIINIIGLVLALVLIVFGMVFVMPNPEAGEEGGFKFEMIKNFFDVSSILIVVGGTVGALIFTYPASVLKNVGKMVGFALNSPKYDPLAVIAEMVDYCKTARMKGILQLEEAANACTDSFTKSALMLIVDANDSEKVKQMLDDAIDYMTERHEANYSIWIKGSAVAPALGMIGTLVGLVNMLKTMDPTDSSSAANLGGQMSVALVTTFYGCILAHLIFGPIGNQLKYLHSREMLCKLIVEEGALAILSGANPRFVQEKLEMMLANETVNGKGSKKGAKEGGGEGEK